LCGAEPDIRINDVKNDDLYNKAVDFRLKEDLNNSLKILFEIKCCHLKSNYTIAEIYLNDFRNYNISLDYFNEVISFLDNYESDREISINNDLYKKSLFMSSYIYSNYLGMYSKGYDGYNIFLNQFPDDELIESVMYELEQLKSKESDKVKIISIYKKREL
tara:strand:- start:284 stop:766 length:483 start_codon:yes stop_codon:yes gene_type:complete